MRSRDYAIIEKLNVIEGNKMTWSEVENRIRSLISYEDLQRICWDCKWLPKAATGLGLERLRAPDGPL